MRVSSSGANGESDEILILVLALRVRVSSFCCIFPATPWYEGEADIGMSNAGVSFIREVQGAWNIGSYLAYTLINELIFLSLACGDISAWLFRIVCEHRHTWETYRTRQCLDDNPAILISIWFPKNKDCYFLMAFLFFFFFSRSNHLCIEVILLHFGVYIYKYKQTWSDATKSWFGRNLLFFFSIRGLDTAPHQTDCSRFVLSKRQ